MPIHSSTEREKKKIVKDARCWVKKKNEYLEVTMPEDAAVHTENGNQSLTEQPNNYVDRLCTFKEFCTVTYTQQSFRNHNGSVNPALCTDATARWICHVHVILPE